VGPWFVPISDIDDPQNIRLTCDIDGVKYQDGNTKNMIFPILDLVAYASEFTTLEPGDLLLTGSPAGVGVNLDPPVFLSEGSTIHLWAEGLGEQECKIVKEG
jgi:2-keto-4-pentenoate hydratase/2-oxohepta-3-ene-1,7-dioic acid hydratase in catechol pathway